MVSTQANKGTDMPDTDDLKAIGLATAASILVLATFGVDLAAWLDVNVGALALGTVILAAGLTTVLRTGDELTVPWALCAAGVMTAAAAPVLASRLLVDEGALRIDSWLRYLNLGPFTLESITREVAEGRIPYLLQTPYLYLPALILFAAAGLARAMR